MKLNCPDLLIRTQNNLSFIDKTKNEYKFESSIEEASALQLNN